MTKVEFLKHLEKLLHVLNEKERTDILNEYTQHIDFKMESSRLSEEAAIKDFGDINELACEILDAYNVNPNYKKMAITKFNFSWKKLWLDTSNIFKHMREIYKKICSSINSRRDKIMNKIKLAIKAISKDSSVNLEKKKEERPKMEVKAGFKVFRDYITQVLYFLWKMFVVICLLPVVVWEFILVIGFGIFVVLAFIGYPVIGFTLIIVGLLMCTTAVIWLVGRFILSKKVV